MFKKICTLAAIAFAVVGCQSTTLSPQAQRVVLSPNQPPHGCKYVSALTGNQGNFFTGGFTSNKNLEQGAMNDLRNQAANLGANYVQMLSNRSGVTGGSGGGQQQTNVVYTGNAYNCPNLT
jgi:hypothetical protein